MNICVYCGSAAGNEDCYAETARELGTWIAESGHTLVYGGGGVGLMGAVSDAALAAGGHVIGVMPTFLIEREGSRSSSIEKYETPDMAQRKAKMIELSDVFIALPGGAGTMEEITEVLSLRKLGLVDAPCAVYNVEGFYDSLVALYDEQLACGFATPEIRAQLEVVDSLEGVGRLVEGAASGA